MKERIFKLLWVFSEKFGLLFLSAVSFYVFAMKLTTEQLGLGVLAVSIVELVGLLLTSSLEDPFVRKEKISVKQDATLFWSCMSLSVIAVAAIILVSFYTISNQEFFYLIAVSSIKLPMVLGARVHVAHLRRDGQFKSLMTRTVLGKIIGGVTGIWLAFMGYGPWAIVAQAVVMEVFAFLVLKIVDRRPLPIYIDFKFLKELLSVGIFISFKALSWDLMGRGVNLVLGATAGPSAVGIFNMAQRLVDMPRTAIYGGLMSYSLPVLSRRKKDYERLRAFYLGATKYSYMLLLPMFLGIALTAQDIILVIFSDKWIDAIPVLQILASFAGVSSIFIFNSSLLMAVKKPQLTILAEVIGSVIAILSLFIFGKAFGGIAGAVALWIRFVVIIPASLSALRKIINVKVSTIIINTLNTLFCCFGMAVCIIAFDVMTDYSTSVFTLCAKITIGILVYSLCFLTIGRRDVFSLKSFMTNA